jgi:long-chain fatty acid transport protein
VVRFGWGKFDDIVLGEPINAAIPIGFRNTWSFAGGFDYVVSPRWTVRGGIQRDLSPTRDDAREERIPDSRRWNFAGGTSFALTKRFSIDSAVEYIRFKDATLNRVSAAYVGTPAQTPLLIDGRVTHGSVVVLSFGGRVKF